MQIKYYIFNKCNNLNEEKNYCVSLLELLYTTSKTTANFYIYIVKLKYRFVIDFCVLLRFIIENNLNMNIFSYSLVALKVWVCVRGNLFKLKRIS